MQQFLLFKLFGELIEFIYIIAALILIGLFARKLGRAKILLLLMFFVMSKILFSSTPFNAIKFVLNVVLSFILFISIDVENMKPFFKLSKLLVWLPVLNLFILVAYLLGIVSLDSCADGIAHFRDFDTARTVMGVPKLYTTGFAGLDVLRLSFVINDPIRGAFFYLIVLIKCIEIRHPNRLLLITASFVSMVLTFSKGATILFLVYITYRIFKLKRHPVYLGAILLCVSVISIYLASTSASSGVIHVAGLVGPFLEYPTLFGNDIAFAGNMGRLEDEYWIESVKRGAESMIGTYFYAFGFLSLILVVELYRGYFVRLYRLSFRDLFVLISLPVMLLQEGHFNLSQVLLFLPFLYEKNELQFRDPALAE